MIKNILILCIFILFTSPLFAADVGYPMPHPFPPFRIMGNVYYVGTDDLASYLIVTPKGNILINSDLEANVPMIAASIKKLGFKFSDTKILLISHAHLDHAAGSKLIKQQTHASYRVMDADVPLVESGGKTDFHYANDASMYFPAVKVDKILYDGDKVQLGGTTLTAHLSAGHTKGCTTWTMRVTDHGKSYNVAIIGSLSVNPGYKLINNKLYPAIANDYIHAFNVLKSMPCDIFLGAHAEYFDLKHKYDLLNKNKINPFIDSIGCKNHIAQKEREFYQELDRQHTKNAI